MTTTTDTIRIECSCGLCKTNAAKLGLPLPLTADVAARYEGTLRGERASRSKASAVHGLVHAAHDPSGIGRAMGCAPVKEA